MKYTTVNLKFIKDEFYRGKDNNFERNHWLYDNVGQSRFTNPDAPDWFTDFSYSNDEFGSYIIVTYSFKKIKDAAIFSLKWSQ